MSFFSDQAAQFQQLADNIQTRITNAGSTTDDDTRSTLEDQRDGLLKQVNTMVLADIQATLAQLHLDRPRLSNCTVSLNKAVQTLKTINQIVAIGAAGLTLATAIASANPGAIFSALGDAEKALADALAKPSVLTMPSPGGASPAGPPSGTISALAASEESEEPAG